MHTGAKQQLKEEVRRHTSESTRASAAAPSRLQCMSTDRRPFARSVVRGTPQGHRASTDSTGQRAGEHEEQGSRYQVYVDFRVAQCAPAAITRYHAAPHSTHGLFGYQVNGKVLIHLNREERVLSGTQKWQFHEIQTCGTHFPHSHIPQHRQNYILYASFKCNCRSSNHTKI